jgi:tol-pal system protein YbgF
MLPAMLRSAPIFVIALACTFWADAAGAQVSPTDLLTRIDRLEETIRNLTGTVEQLQYRNQQLEQQVQRLQDEMPSGARPASSSPPSPGPPPPSPAAQYSPPASPPQYSSAPYSPTPPAAGQYSPPATGTAQYPRPTPPYSPPPQSPAEASAAPIAPAETGAATGRRGDAFDPTLNPNAPGTPRQLGAPGVAAAEPPPPVSDAPVSAPGRRQPGAPLDLSSLSAPQGGTAPGGELPPPPPINPSATGAVQATLPPTSTPKDEYDLAYGYILHKDYGLAADTFGAFLRQYPSDRLAPEAQYWLGEALFQNQRYRDAAEAFLAVSTKYETTARAPDALLRLGQSLAALGEKEAACASLGEVLRKYPRASLSVKQSVDREQKRAHC